MNSAYPPDPLDVWKDFVVDEQIEKNKRLAEAEAKDETSDGSESALKAE